MSSKNTYNRRLHAIAKRIADRKNSDLSSDNAASIRNALHPFYQYLTGQYALKNAESTPIMPIIDLDSATDEELEKLCEFYLDYMRDPDAGPNVRKVKSNFTKNDLTEDSELTEKAMIRAEERYNETIIHGKNNVEFYKAYYAYYQQTARSSISNWESKYKDYLAQSSKMVSLEQLLRFRRTALKKILVLDGFKELANTFTIWENHYNTLLYIDLSCWIALQIVTFSLTKKGFHIKPESIQRLCEKLDDISLEVKPVKCSRNIFMTYSEFLLFAIFRTHFMYDSIVLKNLQETNGDSQNPQEEYSLITKDKKIKSLLPEDRLHVYMEGEKVDSRSFKRNLKKCEEFIPLFNEQTGRTLKSDDITLKAIYRQLILERTVYKKRQSKTIISNFLKNKNFDNLNEYYFIDEKINLGMYREYGLLDEFWIKNEFHEKLYVLVHKLLTHLDPIDIFHEAQKLFDKIFLLLEETVSEDESSVSVDDIEKFLSTMEIRYLNEPKPENNI